MLTKNSVEGRSGEFFNDLFSRTCDTVDRKFLPENWRNYLCKVPIGRIWVFDHRGRNRSMTPALQAGGPFNKLGHQFFGIRA